MASLQQATPTTQKRHHPQQGHHQGHHKKNNFKKRKRGADPLTPERVFLQSLLGKAVTVHLAYDIHEANTRQLTAVLRYIDRYTLGFGPTEAPADDTTVNFVMWKSAIMALEPAAPAAAWANAPRAPSSEHLARRELGTPG